MNNADIAAIASWVKDMRAKGTEKTQPAAQVVRLRCVATGDYDKPPIASMFRENGRYVLRAYSESDFGIPIRHGDSIEVSVDSEFRRAT